MALLQTALADVVIPALFAPYSLELTAVKQRIFQSGLIERNAALDEKARMGGNVVDLPFWKDLSGASVPHVDDAAEIDTTKRTASQETARKLLRQTLLQRAEHALRPPSRLRR